MTPGVAEADENHRNAMIERLMDIIRKALGKEINAIRVEMERVASKLHNHHPSLPENSPNKGRVQTLDALCVESVLTHSYPQESRNTLSRHVPSSYIPLPTPGRRFTTSSTPLPAVDVLKHVHNILDGSYKPTHRESTRFDQGGFDCIEDTMDTSLRRVPHSLPSVDVFRHVHNTLDGSYKPTHRKSMRIHNVGFDYIETAKDTSARRVPSFVPAVDVSKHVRNALDGFHKPTRRNSTCLDEKDINYDENAKATSVRRVPTVLDCPSTFQPVVDASNRVYNLPNTSHNTRSRQSTRFDETDVDYIENIENTSIRRGHPSRHPMRTAGRRITTSTTHIPAVDVSKHVHNLPNTSHKTTRRESTCIDEEGFDYVETTKDTSPRRAPPLLSSVDVSKHVHNTSHDSHNPTLRNSKCSDEICVGYHGNTKDTSPRRAPPLLSSVDVSKHVHNPSGDSHNPTHRYSTRLDAYCVDLIESTEDTSVRHASTNLPTTDAPNRVYHPPTSLSELKDRCPTRFDVSSDIDHQENDKDMSSRRVPSSFLPLAAGRRITTSATCPLAVDVLDGIRTHSGHALLPGNASKRVSEPSHVVPPENTSGCVFELVGTCLGDAIEAFWQSYQGPLVRNYRRTKLVNKAMAFTGQMFQFAKRPSIDYNSLEDVCSVLRALDSVVSRYQKYRATKNSLKELRVDVSVPISFSKTIPGDNPPVETIEDVAFVPPPIITLPIYEALKMDEPSETNLTVPSLNMEKDIMIFVARVNSLATILCGTMKYGTECRVAWKQATLMRGQRSSHIFEFRDTG